MCNMNPLGEHFSFSYFKQLLGTIWPLFISGCSGLSQPKNKPENGIYPLKFSKIQGIGNFLLIGKTSRI